MSDEKKEGLDIGSAPFSDIAKGQMYQALRPVRASLTLKEAVEAARKAARGSRRRGQHVGAYVTVKVVTQEEEETLAAVRSCLTAVENRRGEMREGDKEIARLGRETRKLLTKMKAMRA